MVNMNVIDKSIASCSVPEVQNSDEYEYDLIENKYNAGSIVWARTNGHPWWPAMVDDCPEALRFYELKNETSVNPVKYHVIFFSESPHNLHHEWLQCRKIKPFAKYEKEKLIKKTVFHLVNYKKQVEEAYTLAQKATSMTILQRLQTFSYISRVKKIQFQEISSGTRTPSIHISQEIIPQNPSSHHMRQDEDDEIPATPPGKHHITLELFNRLFIT